MKFPGAFKSPEPIDTLLGLEGFRVCLAVQHALNQGVLLSSGPGVSRADLQGTAPEQLLLERHVMQMSKEAEARCVVSSKGQMAEGFAAFVFRWGVKELLGGMGLVEEASGGRLVYMKANRRGSEVSNVAPT